MVLAVALWLGVAPAPGAGAAAPVQLSPRLEIEASHAERPRRAFGPEPPPDFTGHHAADEVRVEIREDGSVKVDVPRPLRGVGGLCLLGLCLTTRGLRSGPGRKRPIELATAPVLAGLALGFGYVPASKTAATRLLANTADARAQRAVEWTKERLAETERELGQRLAQVLRDRSTTRARKHAIVRELWTDARAAARAEVSDGDELGQAKARSAAIVAETIERFVAAHMPALALPDETPQNVEISRAAPFP
jgi:hypothetical protein